MSTTSWILCTAVAEVPKDALPAVPPHDIVPCSVCGEPLILSHTTKVKMQGLGIEAMPACCLCDMMLSQVNPQRTECILPGQPSDTWERINRTNEE